MSSIDPAATAIAVILGLVTALAFVALGLGLYTLIGALVIKALEVLGIVDAFSWMYSFAAGALLLIARGIFVR